MTFYVCYRFFTGKCQQENLVNKLLIYCLHKSGLLLCLPGWSGGATVLGKLPVPGRPTIWIIVGQGPTVLAVGAGGVCLDIFSLVYHFSLTKYLIHCLYKRGLLHVLCLLFSYILVLLKRVYLLI